MMSKDLYLPYPELCDPRGDGTPYRIVDSLSVTAMRVSGAVDKVSRWMRVPLDACGLGVSRHELGHVLWSPELVTQVPYDPRILATIEDARINLGLANLGLPVELDPEESAYIVWLLAQDAKHGDHFALFVRAIASIGTSIEAALRAQLALLPRIGPRVVEEMDIVRDALQRAAHDAGRPVAPYETTLELADRLVETLRSECLLDFFDHAHTKLVFGCCAAHVDPESTETPPFPLSGDVPDPPVTCVRPGRLAIVRVPLALPQRGGRGPLVWRAAREGSVVRYAHRWSFDGAIFRAKRPRRGGTLLIDTSGSMSLDANDLEQLLQRTPCGTRVALYSGKDDRGELRVVADGGRRASAEHLKRFGSGNVVDLPALEWLARQPRPRVWVSDGAVTGIGDQGCMTLRKRCQAVSRMAAIRRVRRLAEAARLLGASG